MKRFLIALILLLATSSAWAQTYMLLPIVEVYDGDTIKTDLSWRMPYPLNKISIRIDGIDTPEMPAKSYATTGKLGRSHCIKEAELALAAKARLVELIGTNTKMKVYNFKYGKWAGRIVADVKIGGIDIAKTLIKEGFAVEYYGSGPKQDWCQ